MKRQNRNCVSIAKATLTGKHKTKQKQINVITHNIVLPYNCASSKSLENMYMQIYINNTKKWGKNILKCCFPLENNVFENMQPHIFCHFSQNLDA